MAERYSLLPVITGNPYPQNTARHAAYEAGRASLAVSAGSGPLTGQPQEMPDLSALTERGAVAWAGVDAQGLREGVASAGADCALCGCSGEVFEHSEDCDDDLCALNGDMHSCTGTVRQCACKATASPTAVGTTQAYIAAMERAWLWMENQVDAQSKGGHATFDLMMLREERDALRAAIDAAASAGSEPVAHLWQHSETGRTRVVMPDMVVDACATWLLVGPLYLHPSPPEGMVGGWQDIATAPKDGAYLLLWEQYSTNPFVGCWAFGSWSVSHEHVDAEGGWDGANVVDSISQDRITHWMPLPPPPTSSADSRKGE